MRSVLGVSSKGVLRCFIREINRMRSVKPGGGRKPDEISPDEISPDEKPDEISPDEISPDEKPDETENRMRSVRVPGCGPSERGAAL